MTENESVDSNEEEKMTENESVDSNEEEDLDKMLEGMDTDFDALQSFRQDKESNDSLRRSLERQEIYSDLYKPDDEEMKEIKDVASLLGVGGFFHAHSVASELLNFDNDKPKSILLKQGDVECNGQKRILYLLTHGILVVVPKGNMFWDKAKLEFAGKLEDVSYIHDHTFKPEEENAAGFTIMFDDDKNMSFKCDSQDEKVCWINAFTSTVLAAYRKKPGAKKFRGWQHSVVRATFYSAAVIGDIPMMKLILSLYPSEINDLDDFGCSALHYSVIHNHHDCITFLLENNVDTDITTSSGASLADLVACADEKEEILEVFKDHGVILVLPEKVDRDELFGGANMHSDTCNDVHNAAEEVFGQMKDTRNAFNERGEKLKNVANKTSQLKNDAAEYKDLTKKLKEKTKKSWFA